jgi:hypothetical protein
MPHHPQNENLEKKPTQIDRYGLNASNDMCLDVVA